MSLLLSSLVYPVATVTFLLFVLVRLRLFADKTIPGRAFFFFGSAIVFAVSIWQALKGSAAYSDWFLIGAYLYIDIIQGLFFVTGLFLFVAGLILYADFWQTREESLEVQEQKLTILGTIQRDARNPYHLLELLDISLKEIVSNLDSASGAVFLVNRKSRQFVLTAQAGLSREESARFERYPFQRNLLSQTIESGESMIAGTFRIPSDDQSEISRFKSCLILPMISGNERVGGILLLSETPSLFGTSEIRYLEPVAEWLAEKIKSSRLARELNRIQKDLQTSEEARRHESALVKGAITSVSEREPIKSFCSKLVGTAGSISAHIVSLSSGSLKMLGGSEPLSDLSENYRTALTDAVGREKPLVINQEVTAEDGGQRVALSSLLFPVSSLANPTALLLRKESSPFKVSESDISRLELSAEIASLTIKLQSATRSDLSRRRGFEQVIRLLQFKRIKPFEEDPGLLGQTIRGLMQDESLVLTLVRNEAGKYESFESDQLEDDGLTLNASEGGLGRVTTDLKADLSYGRSEIKSLLQSFSPEVQAKLRQAFGERENPNFAALVPIVQADLLAGVVISFAWEIDESQKDDTVRLLTLASGMYNVALAINHLKQTKVSEEVGRAGISGLGEIVNQINNRLAAVIGQAELAAGRDDISGEVRQLFLSVIAESERTADYVRETLTSAKERQKSTVDSHRRSASIEDVIDAALAGMRISDDLYLVNGKTREVISKISPDTMRVELQGNTVHLFGKALSNFSDKTPEDEVISVETYISEGYLYLDISRHRKNFPSVDRVAGFGLYQVPSEIFKSRPQDSFLSYMEDDSGYSFDRYSQTPSYLSFRFPYTVESDKGMRVGSAVTVLAVDDQPVILDLLTAMCQSLDFRIETAESGEEAIALAENMEFDIVLTDLAMPGLSGLETARRIRDLQPKTPIILLTGWEATIDQSELDQAGITEVLYKPFRIEQLTEIIRKRIGQRATI